MSNHSKRSKSSAHSIDRTSIGVHRSIVVENIDKFEFVPHSNFVIVRIVRGSHLDGSCTEFHIDSDRIGDDGNPSTENWVNREFAVEMLHTLVSSVSGEEEDDGLCIVHHRDERRWRYLPTSFRVE